MSRRTMLALGVALVVAGALVGYGLARATADPYTARTRHLVGSVRWSNMVTRLVVFEQDGVLRAPNADDVVVSVITDDWEDASGGYHSGDGYPPCLAATDGSEVSQTRRRVALDVLDRDTGNGHPDHIAVHVTCLD